MGVSLTEAVTPENVGQWVNDLQEAFATRAADLADDLAAVAPADQESINAIAAVGAPELLQHALLWHDGGIPVGDHFLFSCADVLANVDDGHPCLAIGKDIDGELLLLHRETGELSADGQVVASDLGVFFGRFRNNVCSGALEWCEGWVEKCG